MCGLGLGRKRRRAPPQAPTSSNAAPGSVRFAYGGNVAEIPAEFIGGLVLLPLHVNQSQPCLFVLDSTAAATSIDPQRATELGIPAGQSVELEFAGVNLTLPELPRVSKPNFDARFGREYEGTLGRDFFESFVVAIDYERKDRPLVRSRRVSVFGAREEFSSLVCGGHAGGAGEDPTRTAKRSTAISASIRLSMPRCCSPRITRTPTACCRTSRRFRRWMRHRTMRRAQCSDA